MSMMGVSAWRTLHSDRGILENKIERRTLRRVMGFFMPASQPYSMRLGNGKLFQPAFDFRHGTSPNFALM